MYIKVVCCVHFVQRLNLNVEIFNSFNCSHGDNEIYEIVAVKCKLCTFNIPRNYYNARLRSICFCAGISRFEMCNKCDNLTTALNTIALKVCIRKEHFPADEKYEKLEKYLFDLPVEGFFIYSKMYNRIIYRIDHPEFGFFF